MSRTKPLADGTRVVRCLFLLLAALGTGAGQDRVWLRSGGVLEGRLSEVTPEKVTLRFPWGGEVILPRTAILHLSRGAPSRPRAQPRGLRREERFLLYCGEEPVGFADWLATRTVRRKRPGKLLAERYVFPREGARVEHLYFAPEDGGPEEYYFREGTARAERILRGRRMAGLWRYVRRSGVAQRRLTVALGPRVLFPPTLRAALRRLPPGKYRLQVWDPPSEAVVSLAVTVTGPWRLSVLGLQAVRHVLWRELAPGGGRWGALWVDRKGGVRKAALNGSFLVAVRSFRRALPRPGAGGQRDDRRELRWVRTHLLPQARLLVEVPPGGWVPAPTPRPGAAFTLWNRELGAALALYTGAPDRPWPGPSAPGPWVPVAFGGGGGAFCRRVEKGRVTAWARGRLEAQRLVVVLTAPADRAPPAVLDLQTFAARLQPLYESR